MDQHIMVNKRLLWITYAWSDNEEGNFSFLVQELSKVGVEAIFDRIALIPGRSLWEQIGERITTGNFDGWAYLITPNSLSSEACREELDYALSRALATRGREFPLIGLLNDVPIEEVPPALKVRLCVSLTSPNWKDEIKAGLESRPPHIPQTQQSMFIWQIHNNFRGISNLLAIEIRPRFGEINYWRFVVPANTTIHEWGYGTAGGSGIPNKMFHVIEGEGTHIIEEVRTKFFGAGDKLTPGTSAYIVFAGALPKFVGFGTVNSPGDMPSQIEVYKF